MLVQVKGTGMYNLVTETSMTCLDLACLAATMANSGINPVSGETVLARNVVDKVIRVMRQCGIYDACKDKCE